MPRMPSVDRQSTGLLAVFGISGLEQFDQFALRAARLVARVTPRVIAAVTVHVPGLYVVRQIDFQAFDNHTTLESLVEHRERQFDAAEEVAVHPVRARQINR